jgi:RsiW-degrading membrane proteinase PrsW (M82 family)
MRARSTFSASTFTVYSRYVAPVVEELLKGVVIVALIHAHRIGFLVDAAIFGFAVGTGFALVENTYFLKIVEDAGIGTWIVRGFAQRSCTAVQRPFSR